jgi:hypothetical protein
VKGPATAGPGVTGKLGTIKRSNGLNLNGGLWHEVTVSG